MTTLRILNLGAGVGSTTVFLLAREGRIEPFDAVIFADTQEEPAQVYQHLAWMQQFPDHRIHVCTAGALGEDLIAGTNVDGNGRKGGRFASIPAFTAPKPEEGQDRPRTGCEVGRIKRQCSNEYKVEPVWEFLRTHLLGLKPRKHIPRGVEVVQAFGLDDGEPGRMRAVRKRVEERPCGHAEFPLGQLGWNRADCLTYLKDRVPHPVTRSACVFCPYRSDTEWVWLRDHDPAGWGRALEIDRAIRDDSSRCQQGMRRALYLHRSGKPLAEVDIDAGAAREAERRRQPDLFSLYDLGCGLGVCGV